MVLLQLEIAARIDPKTRRVRRSAFDQARVGLTSALSCPWRGSSLASTRRETLVPAAAAANPARRSEEDSTALS
jgi:hypothetical protein